MAPDDAMPPEDTTPPKDTLPLEGKPEITYPCRWSYRVVGAPEEAIRALIREVMGSADYEIHGARPSSKGSYVAVHVSVDVRDEAHRTGLYDALLAADVVKLVL